MVFYFLRGGTTPADILFNLTRRATQSIELGAWNAMHIAQADIPGTYMPSDIHREREREKKEIIYPLSRSSGKLRAYWHR